MAQGTHWAVAVTQAFSRAPSGSCFDRVPVASSCQPAVRLVAAHGIAPGPRCGRQEQWVAACLASLAGAAALVWVPPEFPDASPREKADSTLRSSQAVPHPSTNRALCRLTSEVERDPVHSTRYGRQRKLQGKQARLLLAGSACRVAAGAGVAAAAAVSRPGAWPRQPGSKPPCSRSVGAGRPSLPCGPVA